MTSGRRSPASSPRAGSRDLFVAGDNGRGPQTGCLLKRRERAIETLKKDLTDDEKTFLVSVKSGQPNWEVMGIEGIENLPAIQWKVANVRKIGLKKRGELLEKLTKPLGL